jgi:hypothetical protein
MLSEQLADLLTLIFYLVFFMWVGRRTGTQRGLIILITALSIFLLLREAAIRAIVVRLINLAPKFIAFVNAGGLSENQEAAFAAIGSAPLWVTPQNERTVMFLVWVAALLFIFAITAHLGGAGNPAWARLLGIFNGIVFTAILLPRLVRVFMPAETGLVTVPDSIGIPTVISEGFDTFFDSFRGLLTLVAPQREIVLIVLLTLFLLWVVNTLNGRREIFLVRWFRWLFTGNNTRT